MVHFEHEARYAALIESIIDASINVDSGLSLQDFHDTVMIEIIQLTADRFPEAAVFQDQEPVELYAKAKETYVPNPFPCDKE